jgi:hypothetical protein
MALRDEDGGCLAAALEAADVDAGGGPMTSEPRAPHTASDGGAAAAAGAAIVARLLAAAAGAHCNDGPAALACSADGPGVLRFFYLSRALVLAAPRAAAHGRAPSLQRAAALAALCRAEAAREAEHAAAARGVRVRRAAAFEHHLRRRAAAVVEHPHLLRALIAASSYGRGSGQGNGGCGDV